MVRLKPGDFHAHFCAAVGRLYAGDADAYRAHAEAMTERWSSSRQGAAQERAATAYLLSPRPAATSPPRRGWWIRTWPRKDPRAGSAGPS